MKYATILLLCAVAALAAPPTPCSPPETFQASQETIILNSNGCETTYQTGTVFFDYPSQQLRIDYAGDYQANSYSGTYWAFYTSETAYYYDRDTNDCKQLPLSGYLTDPTIPSDATFGGSAMIGSQEINSWVIPGEANITIVDLTVGECFPVSVVTVNTTSESNTPDLVQSLWNVVPDVPAFVFNLPSECSNAQFISRNEFPYRFQKNFFSVSRLVQ